MTNYHTKNHMHVENVTLRIKDEGLMLDFYLNVMKMKIIKQEPGKFYLGTNDNHVLVILEVDSRAKVVNGTIGLYHYALLLPTRSDLANFFAHYLKTKARLIGASDHSVSEAVYVEDPEGNGIEIYVDRSDTVWRDQQNRIHMITERLDIEDLFKVRTHNYSELPSGTVMGHVHFHVANLKVANTFFVDVLGFEVLLSYVNSAEFTSDQGYHHHVAYNVWHSAPRPYGEVTTGLVSYTVNIPKTSLASLKVRLVSYNVSFTENDETIVFNDMNNTRVVILK